VNVLEAKLISERTLTQWSLFKQFVLARNLRFVIKICNLFLFWLGSSQKVVIFKWLGLPKAEAMLSFPLGAVFALGIYALWQCCGLGLCS
jgi:hypothetical protein